MQSESQIKISQNQGPSGFIQIDQHTLLVDYGKVYLNESPVGLLLEDGLIQSTSTLLGTWEGWKAIEELPSCVFRGIDAEGQPLELPSGTRGPTGNLFYNAVPLNVIYGRISTADHKLIGSMDDTGTMHFYYPKDRSIARKMDENSQLSTTFVGKKSTGEAWQYEFARPLHKKDYSYADNEVRRYFENFERLNATQKKYVFETMKLWASSGLLQIVRKSEGTIALGNVKHGAAGVTGVSTGYATLDREEFEREISHYKSYGAMAVVATKVRPYHEVRINLVVSHEYGHQLEFILSQATQDFIAELYNRRLQHCQKLHAAPPEYDGQSELLLLEQVDERVFVSGYGRASRYEYWAEAVAAFSTSESRTMLKKIDPEIYNLLSKLIFKPEQVLRPVFGQSILDLQTSLRVGKELRDDLLS